MRTPLATLPGSRPQQRLEVALGQGRDGRLVIELCEQHFAEGIGWFGQRTLTLEPSQLKQLQAVLGMKADLSGLASLEEAAPPATIPFPGPSLPTTRRPAVGDAC